MPPLLFFVALPSSPPSSSSLHHHFHNNHLCPLKQITLYIGPEEKEKSNGTVTRLIHAIIHKFGVVYQSGGFGPENFSPPTQFVLSDVLHTLSTDLRFLSIRDKWEETHGVAPHFIYWRCYYQHILHDCIHTLREQRLLHTMQQVQKHDRAQGRPSVVVVPWGAMHMPAFEKHLREQGYVEVQKDMGSQLWRVADLEDMKQHRLGDWGNWIHF